MDQIARRPAIHASGVLPLILTTSLTFAAFTAGPREIQRFFPSRMTRSAPAGALR